MKDLRTIRTIIHCSEAAEEILGLAFDVVSCAENNHMSSDVALRVVSELLTECSSFADAVTNSALRQKQALEEDQ